MKKTQGKKDLKRVRPKMSMGIELVDEENLNHEVEIMYSEMYGVLGRHPKEAVFADMLP